MKKFTSAHSSPVHAIRQVAIICSVTLLLSGCASYPEEHVVSAPPPGPPTQQVVVTQPVTSTAVVTATPLANGQILITQAPPVAMQPTVVVAQPPQPSSSHVWIEGYWAWQTDRYSWVAAHWQLQPYANARWIPPRWEPRSDGNYIFFEGYWN